MCSRIAGGEPRLGTVSMNVDATVPRQAHPYKPHNRAHVTPSLYMDTDGGITTRDESVKYRAVNEFPTENGVKPKRNFGLANTGQATAGSGSLNPYCLTS